MNVQVVNFHQYGSVAALNKTFGDQWLYIGRRNKRFNLPHSPLANRYSHNPLANVQEVCATREEAVTRYALWLRQQVEVGDAAVCHELAKLNDKSVLICWCEPKACHGHVIQRWYEEQRVPYINLAGSRDLAQRWQPLVQRVVQAVQAQGRGVSVGCARGADAFALAAALKQDAHLHVFATGNAEGAGFWRQSAIASVKQAQAAGCWIDWWAGGVCHCDKCLQRDSTSQCPTLIKRLAERSRTCLQATAASGPGAGFVGFVSQPNSRETMGSARYAASLGLPVILFPCGFAGHQLPALGNGRWQPAASQGIWGRGYRWETFG